MPLSGGPADKYGNLYEGRWTVACLLDLMDEKADSIRLEVPGAEGKGFEFRVKKGPVLEYHQVKSAGRWSVNRLSQDGVLADFADRLGDPAAECVFVSSELASELAELSDRARSSIDWEEFNREFLRSDEKRKWFGRFQISTQNISESDAYERLNRIRVEACSEGFLRSVTESRASALVDGDAGTVVDVLAEFALASVHQELTALDVWSHLEKNGFKRRQWDKDPRVLSAVSDANQRYITSLRNQAIGGDVLTREEVHTVEDLLRSGGGKSGILVTGEAGNWQERCNVPSGGQSGQ